MICPRSLNHEKPNASTTIKNRVSFPKSAKERHTIAFPFAKTLKVVHIREQTKMVIT